jgi:hypothetical protein
VELLLNKGANPNIVFDSQTPLSYAQAALKRGGDPQSWERVIQLLLDHGANENLARLSRITFSRPGWFTDETWLTRGPNDFNRYTLFELIGSVSPPWISFPDLAQITIMRFSVTNSTKREIQVDLNQAVQSADCSKDFWLEWGDRVVIPERDHELSEGWKPPSELRDILRNCLTRRVEIVVKDTTNMVELVPALNSLQEVPGPAGAPALPTKSTKHKPALSTFRLKEVVYGANLLRASSDVTRVRVKRADPETKDRKEWLIDLTRVEGSNNSGNPGFSSRVVRGLPIPGTVPQLGGPANPTIISSEHDLWLRDGDVIEIPEKR